MSTDQQELSPANQLDAIREFASASAIEIVRTYSDLGKSGLTLRERPGLRQLLHDVSANPPFSRLLVYDVSRFGRFQDVDESAAYEFHCRSHGVEVIYCVEQFGEPGTPTAAIIKHMKRLMAAEYSRDLSARVVRGKAKVAELGFWPHGQAPYAYERWAVAPDGRRVKLRRDEAKGIAQWHVVLVPGPSEEVAFVRRLFKLFVEHGHTIKQVGAILWREGWRTRSGQRWYGPRLRSILLADIYAGDMVVCRNQRRLNGPSTPVPPEEQVIIHNAFVPIVPRSTLAKAKQRLPRRVFSPVLSDNQMIEALIALHHRRGKITRRAVKDDFPNTPSCHRYERRFGSFAQAIALTGLELSQYPARLYTQRAYRAFKVSTAGALRLGLEGKGLPTNSLDPARFSVGEVTVAVRATQRADGPTHENEWVGTFGSNWSDIVVAGRLDEDLRTVLDYRVLRRADFHCKAISLRANAKDRASARIAPTEDAAVECIATLMRAVKAS